MIRVHRDARKSASRCLQEYLRVPFEFAGKKENVRSPHFTTEIGLPQMPKKMHVCATQFRGQPAARLFLFAPARDAEFNLRPANRLPYYEVYPLVRAERSRAQYDQPIS